MVCIINCSLAFVFIISMIYMMFSIDKNEIKNNFINKLDDNQKNIYKNIVEERRNIYFMGYGIGFIISLFLIYFKSYFNIKINKNSVICFILGITFLTTYFFYILYPKSNYMILHLKNENQIKEWLKVYKTMQWNYHFGLVLGLISILFIGKAFC